MRPRPSILEFTKQHVVHSRRAVHESKHAVHESNQTIELSNNRIAAAQKAISKSAAREKRLRERHEQKAA